MLGKYNFILLFFLTFITTDTISHQYDAYPSPATTGAGIFYTASWNNKTYVLLCKRRTGSGWVNPGGEGEIGETSQETAIRETKEELLDLIIPRIPRNTPYFVLKTPPAAGFHPRGFTYYLYILSTKIFETSKFMEKVDNTHEISEIRWIEIEEFYKLLTSPTRSGEVKALSHDLKSTERIFVTLYGELQKIMNIHKHAQKFKQITAKKKTNALNP